VAANHRITVRARSVIDWGLYTEGKAERSDRKVGFRVGLDNSFKVK